MEVVSIKFVGYESQVYDLETEAGTFVAGGSKHGILVKNTDSCFVKFPLHKNDFPTEMDYMREVFKLGKACAKYCTSQYKPPIELAFENVKGPLDLQKKKRYAFIEWTEKNGEPWRDPHVHYKGLQLIRRDTCKYVKEELNESYNIIMNATNAEEASQKALPFIKQSVDNLLSGNLDYNKLVLSKQLTSRYKIRKNNISREYHWTHEGIQHPHVRLAQQMMKKDPANHPKPPDRVPYLFIEKKGNLLQCDKVIHPENFNPAVHKIDSLYYFDHQLKKPIDMIFKNLVKNPEIIYKSMVLRKINEVNKQVELTTFFKTSAHVPKSTVKFEFIPELAEEVDDLEIDSDNEISENLYE